MDIVGKLEVYRLTNKLSNAEMAKLLDINPSTYSQLKGGARISPDRYDRFDTFLKSQYKEDYNVELEHDMHKLEDSQTLYSVRSSLSIDVLLETAKIQAENESKLIENEKRLISIIEKLMLSEK